MSVLSVQGLSKTFAVGRTLWGRPKSRRLVVDDVSFDVERGETFALVGESGAGKSTTARLVLRLIEPDAGTITLDGDDVRALGAADLRRCRRRMQMILQDPYTSFDPRLPIGDSIAEPLIVHFGMGRAERERKVLELLERVGMSGYHLRRYPRELSGGQLQRAAVARALTVSPQLIVCDEPVAALDVSIRAQVLNLLQELQDDLGISYLFISHDLALVEVFAHRVAVMYEGRIVEEATPETLYRSPEHAYTQQLLDAIPRPVPRSLRSKVVEPLPDAFAAQP